MIDEDKYYIKISHENILNDLIPVPYTAYTYVITGITGTCCYVSSISSDTVNVIGTAIVLTAMTDVLSGGTNGSSILTGLTIPILIRSTYQDVGYYSPFDGAVLQSDVVKNFVFTATSGFPYTYNVYNTSEKEIRNYLKLSSYSIDWGDGAPNTILTNLSPNSINHTYNNAGSYMITMTQVTPWGINTVKKTVVTPFTGTTIPNPKGTAYFTSNLGAWSGISVSYDYIFTGDSVNLVSNQTSNNYVNIPILITGYTNSRISELRQYGPTQYQLYVPIVKDNETYGVITTMSSSYTGYTIQGVNYFDYSGGTTYFVLNSSGLTSDWMVQSAITKNEALMNIVMDTEVQSDVFVERGKNSVLERIERIGEVDNIGDLQNYGYGFFKLVDQNKF